MAVYVHTITVVLENGQVFSIAAEDSNRFLVHDGKLTGNFPGGPGPNDPVAEVHFEYSQDVAGSHWLLKLNARYDAVHAHPHGAAEHISYERVKGKPDKGSQAPGAGRPGNGEQVLQPGQIKPKSQGGQAAVISQQQVEGRQSSAWSDLSWHDPDCTWYTPD